MKLAPKPASRQEPSKFLAKCLAGLFVATDSVAVDIGCGYGRHVNILAAAGYAVLALDIDRDALRSAARQVRLGGSALAIRCDLEHGIPVDPGSAHLVVAVEYPDLRQTGEMAALVAPGGHFILETFSARGGNWRGLPLAGSIAGFLKHEFRILDLQERPAGPPAEARSTVKVFAQRRWGGGPASASSHGHFVGGPCV